MATPAEVERSLKSLVKRLADAAPPSGSMPDRTILCVVPDLDRSWWAELRESRLQGLKEAEPDARADAKITASSDDLIALVKGTLGIGGAIMTRRVKIDASPFDLMLLRKLF